MKCRTKLLIVVSVFALISVGCTTPGTLARRISVQNNHTYMVAYDNVWSAIISEIAELNMPITTLEKESGLIAISDCAYSPNDAQEGIRGSVLGVPDTVLNRKANLNIFARKVDDNKTSVQVNISMSMYIRKGNGSYAFPYVYGWEKAYSNGRIERFLLDGISRRVSAP